MQLEAISTKTEPAVPSDKPAASPTNPDTQITSGLRPTEDGVNESNATTTAAQPESQAGDGEIRDKRIKELADEAASHRREKQELKKQLELNARQLKEIKTLLGLENADKPEDLLAKAEARNAEFEGRAKRLAISNALLGVKGIAEGARDLVAQQIDSGALEFDLQTFEVKGGLAEAVDTIRKRWPLLFTGAQQDDGENAPVNPQGAARRSAALGAPASSGQAQEAAPSAAALEWARERVADEKDVLTLARARDKRLSKVKG